MSRESGAMRERDVRDTKERERIGWQLGKRRNKKRRKIKEGNKVNK